MRVIEISPAGAGPEAFSPGSSAGDPSAADHGSRLGPARVVACPGVPAIGPDEALWAAGAERVLFRVLAEDGGSSARGTLSPEGARTLVRLGVRLFGTDAPPPDPWDGRALEAHRLLDQGGVAFLERLTLAGIPSGEYDLIALPLQGWGADTGPTRLALCAEP